MTALTRRSGSRADGPAATLAVAAMVLSVAAVLSGCAPTPAATVYVTETPEPAETVYVTPSPAPSVTRPPSTGIAEGDVAIEPNAPAKAVVEGPAIDLGARDGAQGGTTSADDGALLTYTVTSGDVFFEIAQRFDVPQQQLLRMNPSIPDLGQTLYIGQVVNLDWTTTR